MYTYLYLSLPINKIYSRTQQKLKIEHTILNPTNSTFFHNKLPENYVHNPYIDYKVCNYTPAAARTCGISNIEYPPSIPRLPRSLCFLPVTCTSLYLLCHEHVSLSCELPTISIRGVSENSTTHATI